MSNADKQPSATPNVNRPATAPRSRSIWQRLSTAAQVMLSLAIVATVFVYLVKYGKSSTSSDDQPRPTRQEEVVQVAGPGLIRVQPGTPVDEKLQVATVEAAWLTAPVLPVTGTTLASLRTDKEESQDSWQFATPDLLTAFSDWQKAMKDIQFQETQLKAVRDLNESKIDAQKKVVARKEKLVDAGTHTQEELAAERTNLIQFEIQARKDIHDQEQVVYLAHRTEATLARQLQQAGLEPTMLRSAAAEGDIVVAEVPERLMGRVRLGMKCDVRFFAMFDRLFSGKVSSISPVISKDKRVLNVQFIVNDPDKLLRPGMFAEIGLGTDQREAKLMPADGVLHIGDKDYALLAVDLSKWQLAEVQTGELHGANIEILSGLKVGDRVLGKGAILLKPVAAAALQSPPQMAVVANAGLEPGDKP
jgi:hypothetical protein